MSTNQSWSIQPQGLRCEHLENPLGIDVVRPRLSWVIEVRDQKPEIRGQKQTAYQILVASTLDLLAKDQGDLWDSGEVRSDQATFIEYDGQPLPSRMRCYWKVKVWVTGLATLIPAASTWSEAACWSMGLLVKDDWIGQWIGSPTADTVEPAPLLRKAFPLAKNVTRATVSISGLGYYELSLNGRKSRRPCA